MLLLYLYYICIRNYDSLSSIDTQLHDYFMLSLFNFKLALSRFFLILHENEISYDTNENIKVIVLHWWEWGSCMQ